MKVQTKLTLFVPKNSSYFVYYFVKYRANLKAKVGTMDDIIIVPYQEFFSADIDIRKVIANIQDVRQEVLDNAENFAVILFPNQDTKYDYYEELTLSWDESIEDNRRSENLMDISIPIVKDFLPTEPSSLYVEMKVSQKYQIKEKPKLRKLKTEITGIFHKREYSYFGTVNRNEYKEIISDKKNNIVRFPRDFNDKIKISYSIGISRIIKSYVWLGSVLGILLLPLIYIDPFPEVSVTVAMGLGMIAYLTGLRFVVLHDTELMSRWNFLMSVAIVAIIILLIRVGFTHVSQ